MDYSNLYIFLSTLLAIFTTTTLAFLFSAYKSKSHEKSINLPPGSFGWPIIGETFAFLHNDHEKFVGDRMKKYSSKIFKTKILGERTVVLCGTAGHKFVASNEEKLFAAWRPHSMQKLFRSSYQKAASTIMLRQMEKHVSQAPGFLRAEALVGYVAAMDSMVLDHLKTHWDGKQVVEAHRLTQLLVLTLSAKSFMGLEDHCRIDKLAELMDTMMPALHTIPVNIPGTAFHRAMKAAPAAREIIQSFIKEKKEVMASTGNKMHDFLSYMIATADPVTGRFMPENEIADKIMGIVAASFNSPAMTTTFIVKFLGERPDIYDKVRIEQLEILKSKKSGEALNWDDMQKMKYSWNVALEAMRLIPPLQGTFREAAKDFTYQGYTIPKGWKVYWTVSTTNMNPEYFPAPEEFDPTRFEKATPPPYTNIPFGSGPRICPGMDYARLQILSFMHHLVIRFKWELVNPNCKITGGMNPFPVDGLKVRLQAQPSQA
ncbi:beta-amyrin 28-monooxygenase-like [Rosa sericea]